MSMRSNTGISSSNELFAMKKNLAFEVKFGHRMSAMTRDFFHKRENLKQEIRDVYGDLTNIRSSTGHSLDQVRSAQSPRKPNAPTIYLPPVGVRLVKKYVGVDFKRMSLTGDANDQMRLSSALLGNAFNIQRSAYKHDNGKDMSRNEQGKGNKGTLKPDVSPSKTKSVNKINNESSNEENVFTETPARREVSFNIVDTAIESMTREPIANSTTKELESEKEMKETDLSLPFKLMREAHMDETFIRQKTKEGHVKDDILTDETFAVAEEGNDDAADTVITNEKLSIVTTYDLMERRSSRSTFRTRSSARLHSRNSYLSGYNMEVIGLKNDERSKRLKQSTKAKEKVGTFYLDYGDGKLHDNMKIPKIKDCSRPWCNPHCKTCQNRSTSRPCFVLIPVDENVQKRKIPMDKRRLSMFPAYAGFSRTNSLADIKKVTEISQDTNKNVKEEQKVGDIDVENSKTETMRKQVDNEINPNTRQESTTSESKGDTNEDVDIVYDKQTIEDQNTDIATFLRERKEIRKKKKTYSMTRLEELAQPRGGPPAEVRFSKMSLRKEQEHLIETERRKALTEYENHNLTYIQGKISLFLALLNQQELTTKPTHMVDLPLREDISAKKRIARKIRPVKKDRNVRHVDFGPKKRFRLLS